MKITANINCFTIYIFLLCYLNGIHVEEVLDLPCAARHMQPNRSVVCVCNATYCDTLVREQPVEGAYIVYTSSNCGLRFRKTYGQFRESYQPYGDWLYVLNPMKLYQGIIGFGGAVTDSAGYNWKSLSPGAQRNLISAYFSELGSEYNVIRTPVAGSDFSMRVYAYNELPVNDTYLSNYTLAPEDYELKIPMIKASQEMATEKIMIVGTTWSPPPWMKSNNAFTGHSRLLKQYYQTYAYYHCLFAEEYKKNGIDIWGFTTTNEPLDGVFPFTRFQTLGFNITGMGIFIEEYLGPTLKKTCSVNNLGIMAVDDQRNVIPIYFNGLLVNNPGALDYIDGIAVHWYNDKVTPATLLSDIIREYPKKFILATEACTGFLDTDLPKVDLGSWERAVDYVNDILEDLRNSVSGWVDWNLCLNMEGGPNWVDNFVDSPIIVNAARDEFYKQPMYYALAHFSKFLPPGSRRIKVMDIPTLPIASKDFYLDPEDAVPNYDNVAFLTPRNTIVFIILNIKEGRTVTIQLGERQIILHLEAESVNTIEFSYDASSIYDDMPLYVAKARA